MADTENVFLPRAKVPRRGVMTQRMKTVLVMAVLVVTLIALVLVWNNTQAMMRQAGSAGGRQLAGTGVPSR